jgi:hypothetical protein
MAGAVTSWLPNILIGVQIVGGLIAIVAGCLSIWNRLKKKPPAGDLGE